MSGSAVDRWAGPALSALIADGRAGKRGGAPAQPTEAITQRAAAPAAHSSSPSAKQGEGDPLPENLKSGAEALSGYSLDGVEVHYDSPEPARVGALAFTRGTDIHVAPGEEQHLPHEAWHVVQQMQGRVAPTMQLKGVSINDSGALEREADAMGGRAASGVRASAPARLSARPAAGPAVVQRMITYGKNKLKDKKELTDALQALFDRAHHAEIDDLIKDCETKKKKNKQPQSFTANHVFESIVAIGDKRGWNRVARASREQEGSRHGPKLPHVESAPELFASTMSGFAANRVTWTRAELTLPDGKVATFQEHNESNARHAEAVILDLLEEYVELSGIKLADCELRLTINNLPCGTGKGEADCAKELIDFKKKHGIKKFHLYFVTLYGDDPKDSITRMRTAGMEVGQFTPKEKMTPPQQKSLDVKLKKDTDYREATTVWSRFENWIPKAPDYELDPESASETESEKRTRKGKRKKKDVLAEAEQSSKGSKEEVEETVASKAKGKRKHEKFVEPEESSSGSSKEEAEETSKPRKPKRKSVALPSPSLKEKIEETPKKARKGKTPESEEKPAKAAKSKRKKTTASAPKRKKTAAKSKRLKTPETSESEAELADSEREEEEEYSTD